MSINMNTQSTQVISLTATLRGEASHDAAQHLIDHINTWLAGHEHIVNSMDNECCFTINTHTTSIYDTVPF